MRLIWADRIKAELGTAHPGSACPWLWLADFTSAADASCGAGRRCCGFGGLFSMKQPELSVAMADDKIDGIVASGATELVGCDQSCLFHLEGRMRRRNIDLPVRHLAEVLDEATSG